MNEAGRTLAVITFSLLLASAPRGALAQQPSIVGTWEWTRKSNGCSEQYIYRDDGTASIRRADKHTENTYLVSWAPEPNGRYQLTMTTVKDDGGQDCAGSTEDGTGRRRTVYVLFSPSRETMIQCDSPAGADCIGPLRRTVR